MEGYIAVFRSIPYIFSGVKTTLLLTAAGLAFGALLGLPLALVRVYAGGLWAFVVNLYIQTIRSLPLLVIIFLFYYGIAQALNLPEFLAAALALAVRSSAYQAELFRGAIQSIAQGQMLAARSLGMTRLEAVGYIIVPQAIRVSIPSWSNEAAIVLKDSSLAYAVGVLELMRHTEYVSARTGEPFVSFMVAGAIYFAITFATNRSLDAAERRLRIPSQAEV